MRRPKTAGDFIALLSGLVGLAVLLGMLGGGIYLIVKGIHDHKTGIIIAGAFLAVCGGAVPVFLAGKLGEQLLRRTVPGARPPKITIALQDSAAKKPGDEIGGHIQVAEAGHARSLTVALRCRDRTSDYVGTSQTTSPQTLATGEIAAATSLPFTIALPPDAPPAYSRGAVAVWWEVEARCDVLGSDVVAIQRVEVSASTSP